MDQREANVRNQVESIVRQTRALMTDGHFVLSSGRHTREYFEADRIVRYPKLFSQLCKLLASHFSRLRFNVVVGPEEGGAFVALEVARIFQARRKKNSVQFFAAKKDGSNFRISNDVGLFLSRQRVLVVDDVLTSGSTLRAVIRLIEHAGGIVVGCGVICNRGNMTAVDLGVPRLSVLYRSVLQSWAEYACPECAKGRTVDTHVAHGARYMHEKHPQKQSSIIETA